MSVFAIQVRTGHESIVSTRLEKLNERHGHTLFESVMLPISEVQQIKVASNKIKTKVALLFSQYVFIRVDSISSQLLYLIRSTSGAVIRVLNEPINESELTFLVDEKVEIIITDNGACTTLTAQLEKIKEFLQIKKSAYINNVISSKNVLSALTVRLPKNIFIAISQTLSLTIRKLRDNPLNLLSEVLRYELKNSYC